jgi:iron-sulfur cluster repair protein YtfE (RIC family)
MRNPPSNDADTWIPLRGDTQLRQINMNDREIDADWTVNTTIQRFPSTVEVFNQYGVDACCGGAATLREAALEAGIGIDQLKYALERAARATATAS